MRLYDRIMTGPVGGIDVELDRYLLRRFRGVADSLARVDITNVVEYSDSLGQRPLEPSDIPYLRPPFESMWLESDQSGLRAGFWMSYDHAENEISTMVFAHSPKMDMPVILGMVFVNTDQSYNIDVSTISSPSNHKSDANTALGLAVKSYLAVSFMNCKNVVIADALDTRTRQQRRYDERKGTKPTEFKTLVIEPMKQVLKTEGGIEQHGLKKALHICRGHFAHYSEDKPLFGKYSGTYWRPAHVRGSAEVGMVGKDYKIKAPRS